MAIDLKTQERRRADRTADDAGWEAKVLARVSGSIQARADGIAQHEPALGWETTVLETLRKRIERESR